MARKMNVWLLLSAVVMIGFPWLAVTFVQGSGGMAVCLLLFFVLDPIIALCCGAAAGGEGAWLLPLVPAGFFLLGAWLMFDFGESDFLLYALLYLILGYGAALLSRFLHRRRGCAG